MSDARGSPVDRELIVSAIGEQQLRVRLAGRWRMRDGVPLAADVTRWVSERPVSSVSFDGREVVSWDSSLVTFVHDLSERLGQIGVGSDLGGLPEGVQRLLALARARPERELAPVSRSRRSWLVRAGELALDRAGRLKADLALLGDIVVSAGRLVTGRARARAGDFVVEMRAAGAQALGIITLTSFLLGAIMAFVGAAALKPFGAGIYVANVVAIATLRELGATITAIVMAGRTGSSYAAQLATMNLTQELDALETMGIGTIDFLVLPRMLALSLMLPLLCIYADLIGIAGGAVVAMGALDLTFGQYLHQTQMAVFFSTFLIGVGKSGAFGVLVAFVGCRAGLRTGRSAAAVGRAATRAMVGAIVAIIVTDGVFAIIFQVLGV